MQNVAVLLNQTENSLSSYSQSQRPKLAPRSWQTLGTSASVSTNHEHYGEIAQQTVPTHLASVSELSFVQSNPTSNRSGLDLVIDEAGGPYPEVPPLRSAVVQGASADQR